jgi:hypothetical protein
MDENKHSRQLNFCARIFAALAAAFFSIPTAHAQQTNGRALENRFLIVFDTSAEMKKRVPMTKKALDSLFVTGMGGQLQTGDTIGVWTFDQNLRKGEFPLQVWSPDAAAKIDADMGSFATKQRYSKTANYGALQPLLDQLVQGSDRLTVVIFCDGETAMTGTPYDTGINQIFLQRQADQKSARQPFIIVLRAQLGKYAGCTVDFPPAGVDFPDFPPLPPPPPPPVPTNPPPAAPQHVRHISIIMIGTNSDEKPTPPKLEVTNSPPPAAPTNAAAETNIASAPEKIPDTQTNALATTENSSFDPNYSMAIGASFLVVAGGLTIFILRRARKNQHFSLITRSMKKK